MTSGLAAHLLRASPLLAVLVLVLPVLAGLAGTLAPVFAGPGPLVALRALLDWPGLLPAARLSLTTGVASTGAALVLTVLISASLFETAAFRRLQGLLAPLLAIPHAAAALGLAFLIAPSGWVARALSPWATGWTVPPDLVILNDPLGASLTLGLIAKELPFLMLVTLAALARTDATRRMQLARSLGYGQISGFCLTVLPALYGALRLPLLAVLAYAMTSVDMGAVLGPTRPPTLAVQITLWMSEPGLGHIALGSAAALVQLGLTGLAILLWTLGEVLSATLCRAIINRGLRLRSLDRVAPLASLSALGLMVTLVLAVAALAIWSLSGLWPFPAALPQDLTLTTWREAGPGLAATSATTLGLGLTVTAMALGLTLLWLQSDYLLGRPGLPPVLLYLPLILPQVCFLPGFQVLALRLNAPLGLIPVALAHLIFVLPYTYLSLSGPFRAWDGRLGAVAATLGASPARIFWRIRLPLLLAPLLTAAAIGFAVSVGQYLPTLLVGGGRVTTLTTEALALASGGNRRLTSAYALLQSLWPALGFALALILPPLALRRSLSWGGR